MHLHLIALEYLLLQSMPDCCGIGDAYLFHRLEGRARDRDVNVHRVSCATSSYLLTRNRGRPSTRNLEESKAFLTSVLPTAANPDIEKFAIMLKDQNVMVGFAGTNRLGPQGMETGYCVKRKYWGMGYASEGFGLFLDMYWGLEGKSFF